MTPAERRRALAHNAVGPAINAHGCWLPLSVRQAAADAVLAAIEPELEHCTHYRNTHDQHHQQPVNGCPWCTEMQAAP